MKGALGQYITQIILQKLPIFISVNFNNKCFKSNDLSLLWQKIEYDLLKNQENWLNSQELELFKKQNHDLMNDFWGKVYEFFYLHEIVLQNGEWRIDALPPDRRILGRIYTPEAVIQYICIEIRKFQQSFQNQINPNKLASTLFRVADISCGTGRFLIDIIANQSNENKEKYFAYDIDPRAIEIAKNNPLFANIPIEWHNLDILITPILEHFDFIIGNPPYIESRAINDEYWDNLRKSFSTAYKKFDLSIVFLERTLQLLQPGGFAGLIITNKWLVSDYGQKIREQLLSETKIYRIIDLSEADVFKDVSTYPMIIFFQKRNKEDNENNECHNDHYIELGKVSNLEKLNSQQTSTHLQRIPQLIFKNFPKSIIPIDLTPERYEFLHFFWERIGSTFYTIGSTESPYEIRDGIHTGNIKEKLMGSRVKGDNPEDRKIITSRKCVSRYHITWQGEWVRYKDSIINKKDGEYAALRERWIFETPQKIVIKLFGKRLMAARDAEQYYTNNSLSMMIKKPQKSINSDLNKSFENFEEEFLFITAILNSKLISTYFLSLFAHTHVRGEYVQFYIKDLELIPFPILSLESKPTIKKICHLSQQLESFYSKNQSPTSPVDLERELDQVIIELYQIEPRFYDIIQKFEI